jgi:hypothetical protein
MGWTLPHPRFGPLPGTNPQAAGPQGWNEPRQADRAADPRARLWALRQGICQCAAHMKYQLGLAAMVLAARNITNPGEKVPEELVGQAIKHVTMHEVGHTLGLRHNFKASSMLKNDQLHDVNITRKQGIVGSVMDYSPVNLAPKGAKQGDYFSTALGPYDYWAIEYAYKPLSGGTEGEAADLQKIATKGAAPGHDYGTDEDLFTSADPLINAFDLGNDPMKFAQDRMLLAEELMKGLAERVVDQGQGYQRARQSFGMLLGQYANAAYLVSRHVGGESVHRDHRGDPDGRDPFVPVPAARQREALKLLSDRSSSRRSCCASWPPTAGGTGATTTPSPAASSTLCTRTSCASSGSPWRTCSTPRRWPGCRTTR